jgi:hypothetical protein
MAKLWSLSDPHKLEVQVKRSRSAQRSRWLAMEVVEDRYVVPMTLKL